MKIGVILRIQNFAEHNRKPQPKYIDRSGHENGQEQLLKRREVLRLSESRQHQHHD
jgi:hypothetical protein